MSEHERPPVKNIRRLRTGCAKCGVEMKGPPFVIQINEPTCSVAFKVCKRCAQGIVPSFYRFMDADLYKQTVQSFDDFMEELGAAPLEKEQ